MKKLLLVASISLLSGCHLFTQSGTSTTTSQPQTSVDTLTAKHFVGRWNCEMDGGKVGSSNQVNLGEDGVAKYIGLIAMPKENPAFQFEVTRDGTWSFANNTLAYVFKKSSVKRAHTDAMLNNINSDKDVQAMEKEYFSSVKAQMSKANQKPIMLKVSNFSQHRFTISQTVGNTERTGQCSPPMAN